MKIIHFANFTAPFKGNFIKSLEYLNNFNDLEIIYCLPYDVQNRNWFEKFSLENKVYLSNNVNCSKEILDILLLENPDLLHTHFEGYDIAVTKACIQYKKLKNKRINVIWHLRNQINFHSNIVKRIYQYFYFIYHYGYIGKNANIISVNSDMLSFINRFRYKHLEKKVKILSNGIDFSKLCNQNKVPDVYTFLALGSRNVQKRIDLLLDAGEILKNKGYHFRIKITIGVDTKDIVKIKYGNNIPEWLILVPQNDNINLIYNNVSCFVSTSIHETFSNAIAEATYFEIPIIQSDINGTKWNSKNPSVFEFKSLDVYDLVEKMIYVMGINPQELQKSCSITKKSNIKNHSIENWAKEMYKFYKTIK